jgi:hypothetical protein
VLLALPRVLEALGEAGGCCSAGMCVRVHAVSISLFLLVLHLGSFPLLGSDCGRRRGTRSPISPTYTPSSRRSIRRTNNWAQRFSIFSPRWRSCRWALSRVRTPALHGARPRHPSGYDGELQRRGSAIYPWREGHLDPGAAARGRRCCIHGSRE